MKNPNWIISHGTPDKSHGTLVCRGTQFEEHWSKILKKIGVTWFGVSTPPPYFRLLGDGLIILFIGFLAKHQ